MQKIIIRILFICITIVSMNLIYQVFFLDRKYNGSPLLFIPPLSYPVFIILTFIGCFIFEKYIMKSKAIWALVLALVVTVSFAYIAKSIEDKFSYIYEHYYRTMPFSNLTHLSEYENKIDNRLTLSRELKKMGIKVTSIEGGLRKEGPWQTVKNRSKKRYTM